MQREERDAGSTPLESSIRVSLAKHIVNLRRRSCGGTRPRKFPTVSRHKALYLKSAMPTSRRCHRYPYGSVAEFSADRTRGSRRGLLTNARDIDGQQRKESAWLLNRRDSVCLSCEVRRITRNDRSTSYNLRQALIVNRC